MSKLPRPAPAATCVKKPSGLQELVKNTELSSVLPVILELKQFFCDDAPSFLDGKINKKMDLEEKEGKIDFSIKFFFIKKNTKVLCVFAFLPMQSPNNS
jgi:hypothetical protein